MIKKFSALLLCLMIIVSSMPLITFAGTIDDNTDYYAEPAKGLILDRSYENVEQVSDMTRTALPSSFDISTSAEYSKYLPPVKN